MTLLPKVKLKAVVNFPATVLDGTGIDVTKSNGTYRFDLDFADFAPPVGSVSDAAHQNALLWNSVTGSYTLAPMALLAGGSLPDAPNTGLQYGRQSLGWTQIVIPAAISPSAALPVMDGIAAPGVASAYSRGDHVHPTDTSVTSFIQAGTGAVTRTMQNKARDFVSARDFGAVGDGVNNDTAAIQAAVTAHRAVYLPPGTYLISGTITLPANTMLLGAGPYASVLVRGGTDQSYLALGTQCVVEKIGMHPVGAAVNVPPSTVPLSGTAIVANSASGWTIRDIWMEYVFNGISMTAVAGSVISNINIHQTYAIALSFIGSSVNDVVVDKFILHGNNTTVEALIKISDGCEALMFTNGDVLLGLYSMFTTAASYSARLHPAFCKFTNVYFDSSANGVSIDKSDGFVFTNCWFSNSASNGVGVFQADDTRFIGCDIVHNITHGATLASINAKHTSFIGCNISANNVGNSGADGIAVVAGVSNFIVSDCTITNNYGTIATGHQRYGINIFAGASTNFVISGNDLSNNVTGALTNGATGTGGRILDNTGYNPVGTATYTLPATGVSYLAGPTRETHYLSGGTVSALTVNSVAITYNGAQTTVMDLGPNEAFNITYTVAPTVRVRSIH